MTTGTQPTTPWEGVVGDAMDRCVAVFGEGEGAIVYTHVSGLSYAVNGVFEAQTEEVDPDTGALVLSYRPMVSLRLSLLRELPKQGDTCLIRSKVYQVLTPDFDGQGTVALRLHER